MNEKRRHSRRAFLEGRAAAQSLVDKAQQWLDATSELILERVPSERPLHIRASRRAMACEFAVQYHQVDRRHDQDFLAALDLIDELENQLTIHREYSDVMAINRLASHQPAQLSGTLWELVALSADLYHATEGAFDITSTPLSRVWGFLSRAGRIPEQKQIDDALQLVGFDHVELDEESHTIQFRRPGMEINFNSVGKGYALDKAAEVLRHAQVDDFLWHAGSSSILARGRNLADLHDCWTVGLRHPTDRTQQIAEFYLRDAALGTAGGATQNFESNGLRYSHLIDPRTGWPASGLHTATVIAPNAAQADALATALFVSGLDGTARYCACHPEIGAVLVRTADPQSSIYLHAFNLHDSDWTPSEAVRVVTSP